ncbi:uncharacterized protein [Atheta coriaria]
MTKLNNLIFGPSEDAETADTQQSVQYGPPPASRNGFQEDCNPCNKEPWIPITTNYGHNQLVGFMQSHDVTSGGNGGLYNQHSFSSGSYGTPNHGFHSGPQQTYNPPSSPHVLENFKPPPQISSNYGPPSLPPISSAPQELYGPPAPPQNNYGPPAPPQNNYGPPPPSDNYGPPPPPSPGNNYGPPPPSLDYGAPISAPSYSAPSVFNKPPAPAPGPSNFGNHYGAPKPIFKIPSKNYGPPINQPTFSIPKPGYSSGKAPRQIRPGFHQRPHMQFSPPPPQPVYKYIPLNKGKYSNLPTNFKPPPPPTNYNSGGPISFNSFGTFVNHGVPTQNLDIKTQVTNPEYLPPIEQLPIATGHNAEPIPFPNLSSRPVAPLHNPQNFQDNFPQPGSHVEIPYDSNVQIQQSIPVADFLASIEHPISVIRSPILDVNVANTSSPSDEYYSTVSPQNSFNNYNIQPTYGSVADSGNYDDYKLSENPIVVEDTHVAAATNENKTVSTFNNLQSSEVGEDFIQQILNGISGQQQQQQQTPPPSTSMQPPPIGDSPWLAPHYLNSGRYVENTSTKKPKQIQIIIPYTTNTELDKQKINPPAEIPKQPTAVINIQEFFKNNKNHNNKNPPFDVIRLQKNIDGWTEQEYSKNIFAYGKTSASTAATSTTKFLSSKRIPDDYLTTLPYNFAETKLSSTTPRSTPKYLDHEPAGSNSKEYLQSNLIATTEQSTTPKFQKLTRLQSWDKIHIAVSPLTKEKIYVVTPQPKTATTSWRQSRENERNSTFSISIMPMRNKTEDSNDVRVVLSEWPHLINNLATITKNPPPPSSTTTPKPTSRHPLFGLMDLSSYTPPANSTIETYSGHSKVINVATASLKKRGTAEEKKVTTTMKSTSLK